MNSSPAVSIHPMREEDLPEVLAIEQVSFPTPFTENLFRMEFNLDLAHLCVARLGGRIAGYFDYWLVAREIHLINIAVHPDFRERGVGTTMMEFLLGEARRSGVEQVILDVRPSNKAALFLYRKFGFRQVTVRKRYYQDNNEDALVMSLPMRDAPVPSV